jgi:hypothetical protein
MVWEAVCGEKKNGSSDGFKKLGVSDFKKLWSLLNQPHSLLKQLERHVVQSHGLSKFGFSSHA